MASTVRIEIEQAATATEIGAFLQSRGYNVNVVSPMVGSPDILIRKPLFKSKNALVRELLDAIRFWMAGHEHEPTFALVAGNERYEFEDQRAVEAALTRALR